MVYLRFIDLRSNKEMKDEIPAKHWLNYLYKKEKTHKIIIFS